MEALAEFLGLQDPNEHPHYLDKLDDPTIRTRWRPSRNFWGCRTRTNTRTTWTSWTTRRSERDGGPRGISGAAGPERTPALLGQAGRPDDQNEMEALAEFLGLQDPNEHPHYLDKL